MPTGSEAHARLSGTPTLSLMPEGGTEKPGDATAASATTGAEPRSKVVLVNRFFHPDHSATSQMATDLAFDLAAAGWPVHVVTSRQRYDDPGAELLPCETASGATIHRVATTRFGRHRLLFRTLDYLSFYLTATWQVGRLLEPGSVLIVKTDPPLLSVALAPIARLKGARLVNWLQDIFPEVAERLGVMGGLLRPLVRPLKWLRDRSLRQAAANVVLGQRMEAVVDRIVGNSSSSFRIPNWQDGDLVRPIIKEQNALRTAWGFTGQFVVGYSGNLGRAHDVATIVGAIAEVARQPSGARIAWLFVGGGRLYDDLAAEVTRLGLQNARFEPYQQRDRLAESLSVPDVHLVTLRPELEGLIVPSKFYGVAAAGRATVFIGATDGEIGQELARTGGGLTVPFGDGRALAEAVLRLAGSAQATEAMGRAARSAFEKDFDRSVALGLWRELLSEVAGRRTGKEISKARETARI